MSRLDDILATLREALPALRRQYGVQSLAVFGSFARGQERPDSDLDVLVDFEPGAKVTLLTLAGVQIDLEDRLGSRVDVVLHRALKPPFREHAERDSIRVA